MVSSCFLRREFPLNNPNAILWRSPIFRGLNDWTGFSRMHLANTFEVNTYRKAQPNYL